MAVDEIIKARWVRVDRLLDAEAKRTPHLFDYQYALGDLCQRGVISSADVTLYENHLEQGRRIVDGWRNDLPKGA